MTPYLLHHLLEVSAATRPHAHAVVDGPRHATYGELDAQANQAAHLLGALGVRRGDRVGLYLDKSLESIVALYAVLKAGAVYVPLDPAAPAARLGTIAADCGIRHLVSSTAKASSWSALVGAGAPLQAVAVLDGDVGGPAGLRVAGTSDLLGHGAEPPANPTIDLDLAYILYTSGSTGRPKGVMLSHLNAMTFVAWGVRTFSVGPEDRLSNHAPLHFDLSVFDVFAAAAAGAALILVPPQVSIFPSGVVKFIDDAGITVWYSVPSVLSMVTLRGGLEVGSLPRLRTVLFAGEVFPTKYLRQLKALLPHVEFHNLYGPTETNVCTHHHVGHLPPGEDETIPIGTAIDDVEVFAVVDGRRAEQGEIGELYVRGTTVMGGYWGDPERSAAVLGPHPLGSPTADLAYRTGDLVEEDEHGVYRFHGRGDAQIKSRGYRIELGEIESALGAHPSVVECAVVAVPDELVTNRIKAFVNVRDGADERELARFCAERVPKYMIPEMFELRADLPRTSTGKIDRQALTGAGDTAGEPR